MKPREPGRDLKPREPDPAAGPPGRELGPETGGRELNPETGARDLNPSSAGRELNPETGARNLNPASGGRDLNPGSPARANEQPTGLGDMPLDVLKTIVGHLGSPQEMPWELPKALAKELAKERGMSTGFRDAVDQYVRDLLANGDLVDANTGETAGKRAPAEALAQWGKGDLVTPAEWLVKSLLTSGELVDPRVGTRAGVLTLREAFAAWKDGSLISLEEFLTKKFSFFFQKPSDDPVAEKTRNGWKTTFRHSSVELNRLQDLARRLLDKGRVQKRDGATVPADSQLDAVVSGVINGEMRFVEPQSGP